MSTEAVKPLNSSPLISNEGVSRATKTGSVTAERLLVGDVTTDVARFEMGELSERLTDQEAQISKAPSEHRSADCKIKVVRCSL